MSVCVCNSNANRGCPQQASPGATPQGSNDIRVALILPRPHTTVPVRQFTIPTGRCSIIGHASSSHPRQGWHFDPLSFWVFVQKPKNPRPKPPPHLGRYLCVTQKPLRGRKPIFTPLKSSKIYQFLPKTQKTQKTQNPKPKTPKSRPKQNEIFWGFCHPCRQSDSSLMTGSRTGFE